jgi:hypothetical protein
MIIIIIITITIIIIIIIIIVSIIIIYILTILINSCQTIFLFFRIVKNITLLKIYYYIILLKLPTLLKLFVDLANAFSMTELIIIIMWHVM